MLTFNEFLKWYMEKGDKDWVIGGSIGRHLLKSDAGLEQEARPSFRDIDVLTLEEAVGQREIRDRETIPGREILVDIYPSHNYFQTMTTTSGDVRENHLLMAEVEDFTIHILNAEFQAVYLLCSRTYISHGNERYAEAFEGLLPLDLDLGKMVHSFGEVKELVGYDVEHLEDVYTRFLAAYNTTKNRKILAALKEGYAFTLCDTLNDRERASVVDGVVERSQDHDFEDVAFFTGALLRAFECADPSVKLGILGAFIEYGDQFKGDHLYRKGRIMGELFNEKPLSPDEQLAEAIRIIKDPEVGYQGPSPFDAGDMHL